jgi:hypothetical protein
VYVYTSATEPKVPVIEQQSTESIFEGTIFKEVR